MGVSRADNSVKIWRNLPISNPKPDLHNINAHTKFGEKPLKFTQVIIRKRKLGVSRADNFVKSWRNLPISYLKPDLYNINVHTKFGENPLMFTQVIIRKRNTDGCTTDGRPDRHTDVQRETIIPRHYRVAGYKNSVCFLLFFRISIRNWVCWFIYPEVIQLFTLSSWLN